MRILFMENYEQYKKGEDHTIGDGLAQRLLEQGKARLPTQTDQRITILPDAKPEPANAGEGEIAPRKKKTERKK